MGNAVFQLFPTVYTVYSVHTSSRSIHLFLRIFFWNFNLLSDVDLKWIVFYRFSITTLYVSFDRHETM